MSAKRNPGAPSRTEKLVSLTYALMSRRRGYTRAELRGIVDDYRDLSDDAFERKFERDKEDLRGLGVVPVWGPCLQDVSGFGARARV